MTIDPETAARVRDSFARQQFMHLLGAQLVRVDAGSCEIRLPFRPDLGQQHGLFHAGVIGTLADNAGGYAAYATMGDDRSVLTVEYKLNLIAPGRGDELIARAYVVKAGRTLTICRSDVFVVRDGLTTLCAIGQQTLIGVDARPDLPAG